MTSQGFCLECFDAFKVTYEQAKKSLQTFPRIGFP